MLCWIFFSRTEKVLYMCRVNMYLIIFFFASMKIMYKDALYVCVCDLTGFCNDGHQYYSLEKECVLTLLKAVGKMHNQKKNIFLLVILFIYCSYCIFYKYWDTESFVSLSHCTFQTQNSYLQRLQSYPNSF